MLDGQLEHKVLMLRAGMDPRIVPDGLKICHNHRKFLGRQFNIASNKCYHSSHGPVSKFSMNSRKYEVTFEQSLKFLLDLKVKVPCGAPVCRKCYELLTQNVQDGSQDMFSDSDDSDNGGGGGGDGDIEMTEVNASDDPNFVPSQGQERIVKSFQDFLESTGEVLDFEVAHVLNIAFERYRDKAKLMNAMMSGVSAVLTAVTIKEEEKIKLWKKFKDSGLIESQLGEETKPSRLLIEVIKSYNSTVGWRDQRSILSLLTPAYSYQELAVFNQDGLEIKWERKGGLTYYLYHEAAIHYEDHGHALAKVFKKKAARWKYNRAMIRSVILFVLNDGLTQKTAWGTVEMKNPNDPGGPTVTVAKGIRIHKDAEVGRQMEAFLKQQYPESETIPAPRTLLKWLENLPASTTRSLGGINPTVNNCQLAYEKLTSTLADLSKKPGINRICSTDDLKCLQKNVDMAAKYMKSYYPHAISDVHTPIATHCIGYGCSSKTQKVHARFCVPGEMADQDEAHLETCDHCELTPKLFQIFTGLIGQLRDEMSATEFNQMTYNLALAEKHFFDYLGFIMRSHMQQKKWKEMMSRRKPFEAFCVADFR